MKKSQNVSVHSVGKAMELIEILTKKRIPLSLAQLTELSGYPKPTVYALLSTMREYSVIDQHADGKYYLGMRLFEAGCAVSEQWDISNIAPPYLEQLSSLTGASSFICIQDGNYIMNILQRAGSAGLHVVSDVGFRMPLHATSSGKLMLSQLSNNEVKIKMNTIGMKAFTPRTITDVTKLIESLDEIRINGYAVEDGEYKMGLHSVSSPVYNHEGQLICAVGIVGLFRHVHSKEFRTATSHVQDIAVLLSNALGYYF